MTIEPVPNAPRLIEWTGERCVPWALDPPVIYEHFHRYLFASRLLQGRDVLELASGEGFGAALLADSARSVVGVDIDEQTVAHSRHNYNAENLRFEVADARDLSAFEPASFGAVVAFELIEHLADHERLLAAIEQVLAPDGILIMSSPDRAAYSDARDFKNPFHVHELTYEELLALLRGRFANVHTSGQRMITGSLLLPAGRLAPEPDTLQRFTIERAGDHWLPAPGITPMYVIAVASNGELPDIPGMSLLVDASEDILQMGDRARASERAALAQLGSVRGELANARHLTAVLEERAAGDEQIMGRLQSELAEYQTTVQGSVTWQLLQGGRRLVYGVLGGRDSPLGTLLQKVLRAVGRLTGQGG